MKVEHINYDSSSTLTRGDKNYKILLKIVSTDKLKQFTKKM